MNMRANKKRNTKISRSKGRKREAENIKKIKEKFQMMENVVS